MPTRLYFRSSLYNTSDGVFTGNGFGIDGLLSGPGVEGGTHGPFMYDFATDGVRTIMVGDVGLTGSAIAYQAGMFGTNVPNRQDGWSRVTGAFDSDTDALTACAYIEGLWFASSDTGKMWSSPDGESGTWTLRFTPSAAKNSYRIVKKNGVYFMLLAGGTYAQSTDGINWQEKALPGGAVFNITNVEYSAEQAKWVFCGSAGSIAITTDLVNFTLTDVGATTASVYGLIWVPSLSLWVACGSGGMIRTSPTAATGTWTLRTSGTTNPLISMDYDGTTFVAVGDLRTVTRSTNAVNWTTQSFTSGPGDFWTVRNVDGVPGKFLACTECTPSLLWQSLDSGATWQPLATEQSQSVVMPGTPSSRSGLFSPDALNLRTLSTTAGTAQRVTQITTAPTTAAQNALMFIGASDPILSPTTIGGGSIILNAAEQESNLNVNFWINAVNAYVWRPSTGELVGYIRDAANTSLGGTEPSAAASIQTTHITGITSSPVQAQAGDVIYVEVWARFVQGMSTAYTAQFAYDGSVVNTTQNAIVTNHASFIEFTENVSFGKFYRVTANRSIFSVSGGSGAGLLKNSSLPADTASFAATGVGADFIKGYALSADPASYVDVETDTGLLYGRRVFAEAGNFALTTVDTGLARGSRLTADRALYNATANNATLTWVDIVDQVLTADQTSYSVAAQDAGLRLSRRLIADTRSYATTGIDAGLVTGKGLVADAGSVSLALLGADLRRTALLTSDQGLLSVSTRDAGLVAARILSNPSRSYSAAAQDATIKADRFLPASTQGYNVTQQAADVLFGRYVSISVGSVIVSTINAGRNLSLVAEPSSVVVTFVDGDVSAGNILRPISGTFSVATTDTGLRVTRRLLADQRSYTAPVTDTGLRVTLRLVADQRSYVCTAQNATLFRDRRINADRAGYASGLVAADLRKSLRLPGDTAAYLLTGYAATLQRARIFSVSAGAFYVTGYNSGPVFSNLPPAFDVVVRPYELTQAARPAESRLALRPFDLYEAGRPVEGRTAVS